MKRIIPILLVSILCLIMLPACGMNTYARRLEKAGYEVEKWNEERITEYFTELDLSYDIKSVISAEKDGGNAVSVFNFSVESQAKSFEQILTNVSYPPFKLARKGNYVIFGVDTSVDIVLGK